MPYSPISLRQINTAELNSFTENFVNTKTVQLSGDQVISGDKTFVDAIIPSGGFIYGKKYINGSYNVGVNDYFLCVNASGLSKTLTFDQLDFVTGKEYRIKDFRGLSETSPIILTGVGITFDYSPSLVISGNFAALHLVAGSGFNYEIN